MVWLVDCGNTRWKWSSWTDGLLGPVAALPAGEVPTAADHQQRLIVLPTAAHTAARLGQVGWHGQQLILGGDVPGCPGYPTHGLDRQAGGYGAKVLLGPVTQALVVDAGTAITADAWDLTGDRPRWLAGWIIPGPQAAMAGLAAAAPALPPPAATASMIGTSPAQLAVGPQLGWPAMVWHLVADLLTGVVEDGDSATPVILTGGDAVTFRPALAAWSPRLAPDLVLHGMLGWAGLSSEWPVGGHD